MKDFFLFKITQILPTNVHKLIKNYLWGRYFQIKSKDVTSSSILGHLSFTADMPTSVVTDDTTVLSTHKDSTVGKLTLEMEDGNLGCIGYTILNILNLNENL